MANIRKTFNFREGVKVDDSVLVVAGQRVGIGSTIPSKVLDINCLLYTSDAADD